MTVRGLNANVGTRAGYHLSHDAINALRAGNIDDLLNIHRNRFGGWAMMADEDNDDDDDDSDADADNTGDSGAGDDDDDDRDADDGDDDDDKVSKSEFERLKKRMQAADKQRAAAQKELDKINKAKKSDLDNAVSERDEALEKVKTLSTELSSLRLQNAFLASNKHSWHDAETALALADKKGYLEDVVDEETGQVDTKALKKALDKLATEHKYLVDTGKSKNKDEDDGPSGAATGGRSKNSSDKGARQKELGSRFSSLSR